MGGTQPVIEQAMNRLAVELCPGFVLKALDGQGVTLSHGTTTEHIDACTVAACAANTLAVSLPSDSIRWTACPSMPTFVSSA